MTETETKANEMMDLKKTRYEGFEITTTCHGYDKSWIAEIKGTDPKWGLQRDFVSRKKGNGYQEFLRMKSGVLYEYRNVSPRNCSGHHYNSWLNRIGATEWAGFFVIENDEIKDIDANTANEIAKKLDEDNPPIPTDKPVEMTTTQKVSEIKELVDAKFFVKGTDEILVSHPKIGRKLINFDPDLSVAAIVAGIKVIESDSFNSKDLQRITDYLDIPEIRHVVRLSMRSLEVSK